MRLNSILCGLFFVFIVGMRESLAVKLDQHEVLHVCIMVLRVTHCPRSTWRELGVNSVLQPEIWKKLTAQTEAISSSESTCWSVLCWLKCSKGCATSDAASTGLCAAVCSACCVGLACSVVGLYILMLTSSL